MKEQAQLREEMAYQYKLGNFEVRMSLIMIHYFLFPLIDLIFRCPDRLQLLFKDVWTLISLCRRGSAKFWSTLQRITLDYMF